MFTKDRRRQSPAAAVVFFQHSVWAKPKIRLNYSSLHMDAGESIKLKLNGISSSAQVSWKSSASETASVTKKGKVTAKKEGTATVTASCGGKKYRCRVQVTAGQGEASDKKNGQLPGISAGSCVSFEK